MKIFVLLFSILLSLNVRATIPTTFLVQKLHDYRPGTVKFNWEEAVLFWGMYRYSKSTSSLSWYIKNQLTKHYEYFEREGYPKITSPDLAAPSLVAAMLMKENNFAGSKVVSDAAKFFLNEPKNHLGTLNHIGNKHRFAPWLPRTKWFVSESIWADSMIMYGLASIHVAQALGHDELMQFANKQPKLLASILSAPDDLFFHGYYLKRDKYAPKNARWLRGNGWVFSALIDAIEMGHDDLRELFIKASDRALEYQDPNGAWKTVMNEPGKGKFETSGTALLSYALLKGARLGVLSMKHKKAGLKAYHYVISQIDNKESKIIGCSGPTNLMPSGFFYRSVIVNQDKEKAYCFGSVLLAASEYEELNLARITK